MSSISLSPWKAAARIAWPTVLFLAVVFALMRAVGMLGPSQFRWMLPLGFVLMAITPWLLLTRDGRKQIGLTAPRSTRFYVPSILLGAAAAFICFLLGVALFGASEDNWFVSIASNYRQNVDTTGFSLLQLHLMFTVPAVLFSPIGEEIFFRGLLQRALEERLSARNSTLVECGMFGVVHLCHHGLAVNAAGFTVRPLSGGLWVMLMFLAAYVFARLRQRSDSLYPAMISHATFNVVMNVFIFSVLWQAM